MSTVEALLSYDTYHPPPSNCTPALIHKFTHLYCLPARRCRPRQTNLPIPNGSFGAGQFGLTLKLYYGFLLPPVK